MVKVTYENYESGFKKAHEGDFTFGAVITGENDSYKTRVFSGGEMNYDDLPEILASITVSMLEHIEGDKLEKAQRITHFGSRVNERVSSWLKEHKADILQGIDDFINQMS